MEDNSIITLIVIAVIVFGVLYLLMKQLNRFFPLGCFIPALIAAGGVLIFLMGTSLFIDTLEPTSGRVITRTEEILARSSGNWRRSMTVVVQYGGGDGAKINTSEFHVDGQTYDQLVDGGPAAVRVVALGDTVLVSRLAEMDTRSIFEQAWAAIRLWLPLPANDDRETAAAKIRAIRYIDHEIQQDEDGQEQIVYLFQPVELVEFEFTPAGRSEPVVAAEKIDAGSLEIIVGGRAQAQYDSDNPRSAVLADAGHSFRWQNPLGQLAPGIAILGILAVVGVSWRFAKKLIGGKVVK